MESLGTQSYKKFEVMIIYSDQKKQGITLDAIKESKTLSLSFVKQDRGFFEEALNTAYRKADGDIVIHTDDDAIPSKNWIKEHIEFHMRWPKAGMATGFVIENAYADGTKLNPIADFLNAQKWRMLKHTIIDKPIEDRFKNYGMYIGRSGMLVDTGRRENLMRTFRQHGVNMSWKQEALHGFKLPGYTKQGSRNEAAAALEVIKRSYEPLWFNRAGVLHPIQKSLSRGVGINNIPITVSVEDVLFSYYTSKTYDINIKTLRLRTRLDDVVARAATFNRNRGYSIGYEITKNAIQNDWKPEKIRKTLLTRFSI